MDAGVVSGFCNSRRRKTSRREGFSLEKRREQKASHRKRLRRRRVVCGGVAPLRCAPASPSSRLFASGPPALATAPTPFFSSLLSLMGVLRERRLLCWFRPVPSKNDEGDVVRHQQRRNPERRNPVGGAHVRRRVIDRSEDDRREEIQSALNVEDPDEKSGAPSSPNHRRDRGDGQHSSQEIAEGRRIGEGSWNARVGGPWRQKHQTKVSGGVQQQNRQQDGPRLEVREPGDDVDSGRDPEDQRAEKEIDREDVHVETLALPGGFYLDGDRSATGSEIAPAKATPRCSLRV